MAFASHLDRRGPLEHSTSSPYDRPVPSWSSGYVPANQRPFGHHAPLHQLQASSLPLQQDDMNPENEDSDVSVTRSDPYRNLSSPAIPVRISPAPLRLESQDVMDRRLNELSRAEDQNSAKVKDLRAKRQRMDDKIKLKRDAQDRKIQAIMDARLRKDKRIAARREKEDAEFQRIFDQIEQEEETLRRRLKRLKRGLPLDESPQIGNRSISAASASPPAPYSTVPPPAKRHQPNPPGHSNSPNQGHSAGPQPNTSQAPSYSFYGGGAPKPYGASPHNNSGYSTIPPASVNTPTSSAADRFGPTVNGRAPSPLSRPPQTTTAPATSALSTAPPPRTAPSAYDTRPPPPAPTSGFTTVNAPTTSGFASVNSRPAETPPSNHLGPVNPNEQKPALNSSYSEDGKPSSNGSTPVTGKRTPSTTHPYQMSEAFANRHHHCERVDELNRGIWTSYGPGGSQEHPTGPPVQMYLRCNHDECRRIDWRTVHGLQCHIVKNHEQPKGTIGSLEKALDRYGVPVSEVEEYEREHGEGSGGTMADPKNMKIKNKTREASFGRKTTPGSFALDPNVRPAGYKPSPTASPTSVHAVPRHVGPAPGGSPAGQITPSAARPPINAWSSINNVSAYGPPRPQVDTSKQLQGDAVMKDAPPLVNKPPSNSTPTTNGPPERKPYDFAPRPFEYPSRDHPITPGSGTTKSPGMQNGPSWRVSTGPPKASPQSPPVRPYQTSWSSRPVWGTDSRVAEKIAADAKARKEELSKKAEEIRSKEVKMVSTPFSAGPVATGQSLQDPPKVNAASPTAAGAQTSMMDGRGTASEPQSAQVASTGGDTVVEKPLPAQTGLAASKPIEENKPKEASAQETSANAPNATTMEPPVSVSAATSTASGPTSIQTTGGPASGTRSAQSPSVSTKPPSAPTSVRRGSRRSSVVASASTNSALPQTDVLSAAEAGAKAESDAKKDQTPADVHGGEDAEADGDSITVTATKKDAAEDGASKAGEAKDEVASAGAVKGTAAEIIKEKEKEKAAKEPRTPPPRRSASTRITRKRTGGI